VAVGRGAGAAVGTAVGITVGTAVGATVAHTFELQRPATQSSFSTQV
jgi:hypothetical protein